MDEDSRTRRSKGIRTDVRTVEQRDSLVDPELVASELCIAALGRLDVDQRARVLRYLNDRFSGQGGS